MDNQPFFSIILPTRNNAEYLGGAIATVLNQELDDYELIVSNNFSEDNTEEVIKSFTSDKLKYIKTKTSLYYDEHWNFALSHASGKYILMLGDDDGVTRFGLKELKKEIVDQNYPDLISQPLIRYFLDDNKINFNVLPYIKVSTLSEGFNFFINGQSVADAPLHTIIKKECIKKNVFYSNPFPDYVAFAKALHWANSLYYSNTYVTIHGYTKKSAGGMFALKDLKKLKELSVSYKSKIDNVPLDLYFFSNGYYASMRTAIKELNLDIEIDWTKYFRTYHGNLLGFRKENDISEELNLFYKALNKQPLDVRLKTKIYIFLRHTKHFLKKLLNKEVNADEIINLNAKEYNIKDIVELSKNLDNDLILKMKKDLEKIN